MLLSRRVLAALIAVLLAAVSAYSQETDSDSGTISGVVLDAAGEPVSGVQLFATPLPLGPTGRLIPTAESDEHGQFDFLAVPAGEVALDTEKCSDGYPDTRWSGFETENTLPHLTVVVEAQHATAGVIVRLGPPVGVLTLRFVDTAGRAVRDVGVRLIREDSPEFYWSSNVNEDATRAVALPPVPFTVEVTGPGWVTWRSDDAEEVPEHHIMLRTDERRSLTVTLHLVEQ